MKYEVKSDFDLDVGKVDPLVILADGNPFVPAKFNVPLSTVEALVKAGTIVLIKPEPKSDPAVSEPVSHAPDALSDEANLPDEPYPGTPV